VLSSQFSIKQIIQNIANMRASSFMKLYKNKILGYEHDFALSRIAL